MTFEREQRVRRTCDGKEGHIRVSCVINTAHAVQFDDGETRIVDGRDLEPVERWVDCWEREHALITANEVLQTLVGALNDQHRLQRTKTVAGVDYYMLQRRVSR